MTQEQINRIEELENIMEVEGVANRAVYNEWEELCAIRDFEYRMKHEDDLKKFFDKYISGKSLNEISPENWDYYSDYHKEVYGFRPRQTITLGNG